jgi:polysaccharide deacetylase 2 family uncharacterized protein YibQ
VRPLFPFSAPARVKAALFFYAFLIILGWLFFSIAPPSCSSFSLFGGPNGTKKGLTAIDPVTQEKMMRDCWDQLLVKSGYQINSQTIQTRFGVKKDRHRTFPWVRSEMQFVLPAVVWPDSSHSMERSLLRLGSTWKGLAKSGGLFISQARWGYSHSCLWVKIDSHFQFQMPGARFIIPAQQITLVQPIRPSKIGKFQIIGLVPSPDPKISTGRIPKEIRDTNTNKNPPRPLNWETEESEAGPRVAIIIDDIGYCRKPADEMLKIPAKLTWAILPFAPYSAEYLEAAKAHGCEIILHLPLEPVDHRQNPGPGEIIKEWSRDQIIGQLNKDLNTVYGAVGINNHMGSAGTQDDRLMEILMREIKQRKLFFVDSMTGADSVAQRYAGIYRVPFAKRKVFIDNEPDLESKKAALRELIHLAVRDGAAIGIAHAREGSAQAITEMLPEFIKAGVEIVPVSELVSQ